MKKVLSIAMMAITIMAMCVTNVHAVGEKCSIKITPEKTEIKAGETVRVAFAILDLDVGTSAGLFSMKGQIEYDTTAFETINQSDIIMQNNWKIEKFTANDGQIAFTRSDYVNSANNIFSINLKAKSTLKAGQATISFKNGTAATDTDQKISIPDTTYVIKTAENTTVTQPITTPTPATTQTPTQTQITTQTPSSTTKTTPSQTTTSSTKNSNLPRTGVETFVLPIIAIAIVTGIFAYMRYNKLKY